MHDKHKGEGITFEAAKEYQDKAEKLQKNVIAFDYIRFYFAEYIFAYIVEIVESNDL